MLSYLYTKKNRVASCVSVPAFSQTGSKQSGLSRKSRGRKFIRMAQCTRFQVGSPCVSRSMAQETVFLGLFSGQALDISLPPSVRSPVDAVQGGGGAA